LISHGAFRNDKKTRIYRSGNN